MTDLALSSLPTFEVPAGAIEARCRHCGAPVYWISITGGKRIAIDSTVPPTAHLDGMGVAHVLVCVNGA